MTFKPNYKGIATGLYIAAQTMLPLTAFAQDNYQNNSKQESKLEQSIEKTILEIGFGPIGAAIGLIGFAAGTYVYFKGKKEIDENEY